MDGVLIVNKPAGMTSHDVVAQVRRILNERSVGHLGTLDPSATGVLPLVTGKFTRLSTYYGDADKRYEGTIHFGQATDTYDAEGDPVGDRQAVNFSLDELRQAARRFVGLIQQIPPPFSAKKIAGVPAYKMARKNQPVELQPKAVEVKEFEIVDFDGERARFRAWVSSGTYIRSIAHDLGQALGCGAHLAELTRTAVREFGLAEAHSLEALRAAASATEVEAGKNDTKITSDKRYYVNKRSNSRQQGLEALFLHPRLILPEFPAVTAPPEALVKIRHGNPANLPYFGRPRDPDMPQGQRPVMIRVYADQTHLVALARQIAGTLFQPKVVLM